MDIGDICHSNPVQLGIGDALIVVDMQNDFIPGGALPVEDGDTIIKGINRMMQNFFGSEHLVVLTQDWHNSDHKSFASAHPGKKPYEPFSSPGIGPILWPDHCIKGTKGADFHDTLEVFSVHVIIRKGYHCEVDSYSGFLDNDNKLETGLDGLLKGKGITRIFISGLALDYCVFFTAKDGCDKGYEVFIITDLTKAVGSPEESVSNALETMTEMGVKFIQSGSIISE